MFLITFFKSLKPVQLVGIGIALVLILALAFFYHRYTAGLVNNGKLQEQVTTAQAETVHQDKANQVSDKVVASFVKEKDDDQRQLTQSRGEVIDEYLENKQPVPVVATPVVKVSTASKTSTAVAQPTKADNDERNLRILSQRMYERYCTAAAQANCNTANTAN